MRSKSDRAKCRLAIYNSRVTACELSSIGEDSMPAKPKAKVTPSSGNVFRDLGFSAREAEHLVMRADLLIEIRKVVATRRLTQVQLAKLLHVSQPRVSDLLRGRLHLFSIETLIDMLGRLGVQVQLVVKPARRRQVA